MSVFEYIFSLYSLLLGLALAHLLSGLAKVVEARDRFSSAGRPLCSRFK